MIRHIKVWWRWQKKSLNSFWYKLLVLFGLVQSPTFMIEYSFYDYIPDFLDEEMNISEGDGDKVVYRITRLRDDDILGPSDIVDKKEKENENC